MQEWQSRLHSPHHRGGWQRRGKVAQDSATIAAAGEHAVAARAAMLLTRVGSVRADSATSRVGQMATARVTSTRAAADICTSAGAASPAPMTQR